MSFAKLIEFRGAVPSGEHVFRNSWGGANRIFSSLFEKYIEKTSYYDNWIQASSEGRFWESIEDSGIDNIELTAYWLCLDNALVKRENFLGMSDALRSFIRKHPTDSVCHLEAWAQAFRKSDADFMGVHATSVSPNQWCGWDEESDSPVPYDVNEGDRHWFVFERLSEWAEGKN